MEPCLVGGKRPLDSIETVETVKEVYEWLETTINTGGIGVVTEIQKQQILSAVKENQIDGEVLKSLNETDFEPILGVRIFGQRRKLRERIKQISVCSNLQNGLLDVSNSDHVFLSPQPAGEMVHRHTLADSSIATTA